MLNKKLGLIAILASVAASDTLAGNPPDTLANYSVGDVLVCFQKGGVDMVVDAGPISIFTNATHNQRITITQYTGTQLAQVGTNGVNWSAFAWLTNNYTLFITRPRTTLNQQTTPWLDESSPAQSGVALQMAAIPPGALDELNLLVYPVSTSTAVVEEGNSVNPPNPNYTDGLSYQDALSGSYGGNFDGYFEGSPENTTSNNFTLKGAVVQSDFYQLTPTSGHAFGQWLGYFEFNTNGVMTYVAYPTTTPLINSFSRSGTTATIAYKSGLYGTYTLLGTNNISAPLSTWPVIGTLSTGDTLTHTVQDTDTTSNKFYIIQGQ
jgi:hypothetical protein